MSPRGQSGVFLAIGVSGQFRVRESQCPGVFHSWVRRADRGINRRIGHSPASYVFTQWARNRTREMRLISRWRVVPNSGATLNNPRVDLASLVKFDSRQQKLPSLVGAQRATVFHPSVETLWIVSWVCT